MTVWEILISRREHTLSTSPLRKNLPLSAAEIEVKSLHMLPFLDKHHSDIQEPNLRETDFAKVDMLF